MANHQEPNHRTLGKCPGLQDGREVSARGVLTLRPPGPWPEYAFVRA